MTFSDLFSGVWTWRGLMEAILPLLVVAGASFFAGWERGWNDCARNGLAASATKVWWATLDAFLAAIIREHGVNDHVWLVRGARDLQHKP